MKPRPDACYCPVCGAIHPRRVSPTEDVCRVCGSALHPAQPYALTWNSFEWQIGADASPIAVHYRAAGCAPCDVFEPTFAQAATFRRQWRFASCDTERERVLAQIQGIDNLPTVVVYACGRERARISGTMRLSALLDWLDFQLQGFSAAPRRIFSP